MKRTFFILWLIFAMFVSGCSVYLGSRETVEGSGVAASETRPVSKFTAIQLSGSADVTVTFGETQSVMIEADDNLLPLIETRVSWGKLIIRNRPNANLHPRTPVRVTITMQSLKSVSLPGSGNIAVSGLQAGKMQFDMRGSGNITADGAADSVTITLNGSGNILCRELQAQTATAKLSGSGIITVYASQKLEATISGSGSIQYAGSPGSVKKYVPGSGVVQAAP